MSDPATRWACEVQFSPGAGTSAARNVLTALASFHNGQDERCFPSIATLSGRSCESESTVRRALRNLEKLGAIIAESRPGKSTAYRLNIGWQPAAGTPVTMTGVDSATPVTMAGVDANPSHHDRHPSHHDTLIKEVTRASESPITKPVTKNQIESVLESWNEVAARHKKLDRAKGVTDNRRELIGKMIRNDGGLDGWTEALIEVDRSRWLCGEVPGHDGRSWAPDLNWLLNPDNRLKVREGKYRDSRPGRETDPPPPPPPLPPAPPQTEKEILAAWREKSRLDREDAERREAERRARSEKNTREFNEYYESRGLRIPGPKTGDIE